MEHIQGVRRDHIRAAIALPSPEEEPILQVIADSMQHVFDETHRWNFDGPESMLTWPCRVILSRTQSSQVELFGKTRAFIPYKGARTLKIYFALASAFWHLWVASRSHGLHLSG